MTQIGIEKVGVYAGSAVLDVNVLAQARGLEMARFQNLLMQRKSVALPVEDPVSFAVNAGKSIIDRLSTGECDSIRHLIIATESGIDFGKAMSSYVQHYLGLGRHCRTFEVKHACFGGTAALQTASAMLRNPARPGERALVITTDVARPIPHTYAEPSQGAAAVAILLGPNPGLLLLENKTGSYSYEVMDSCRPTADIETGDPDLSLLSYLDCIRGAFEDYKALTGADIADYFDGLAFHTPFGGMVKGAHRAMMRDQKHMPPPAIAADFDQRLRPSLNYCAEVGNIYSGSVFLAMCGAIEALAGRTPTSSERTLPRLGIFSYGSGCCSEFYSGIVQPGATTELAGARIGEQLSQRHPLGMAEYERLLELNRKSMFGVENMDFDPSDISDLYRQTLKGSGRLVLRRIESFQRQYIWA